MFPPCDAPCDGASAHRVAGGWRRKWRSSIGKRSHPSLSYRGSPSVRFVSRAMRRPASRETSGARRVTPAARDRQMTDRAHPYVEVCPVWSPGTAGPRSGRRDARSARRASWHARPDDPSRAGTGVRRGSPVVGAARRAARRPAPAACRPVALSPRYIRPSSRFGAPMRDPTVHHNHTALDKTTRGVGTVFRFSVSRPQQRSSQPIIAHPPVSRSPRRTP